MRKQGTKQKEGLDYSIGKAVSRKMRKESADNEGKKMNTKRK